LRQSRRPKLLLVVLTAWNLSGCASFPGADPERRDPRLDPLAGSQAECLPRFPDQKGWYGGDAAYSIALPIADGRSSLWLFGDSFVAHDGEEPGRQYPLVHNSIAISRCSADAEWELEFFWGRGEDRSARAFIEPDPDAEWVRRAIESDRSAPYYWLFDGFVADEMLFIGLLRIEESEPRGPLRLPFRLLGMDLARIENFRDPPEQWKIRISTLSDHVSQDPSGPPAPHTPVSAFPGSAFVIDGDFVYAFSFLDRGDGHSPRSLTRVALAALTDWRADLSRQVEVLTADGLWRRGIDRQHPMILMDDDATEMSVHFDHDLGTWLAVYSRTALDGEGRAPARVWLRTAPDLEGPWSDPITILGIPEMAPDAEGGVDENLFCYAGKAHPQFAAPRSLVVTYVCNLFARDPQQTRRVLLRLRESAHLYRPRALPVPIPDLPPASKAD
jgi:hypothetical protein